MYCELVLTALFILPVAWSAYQKMTNSVCKSKRRLDGKTCVVTGGTSGMGLEVAKDFAKRGARVIIACPFEQEGADAKNLIVKTTGNRNVEFKLLNLSSLQSTREFAEDILKNEDRLDVLVNNAGIGATNKLTKDNLNFTMQVNYYGHFLLTVLLLPLLKKTGTPQEKSRIVNVASLYHYVGRFRDGQMNSKETSWHVYRHYANSKFCLLLLAVELKDRLEESNVVVNAADPGLVGTAIFRMNFGKFGGSLIYWISNLMFKTAWEGAQNTIYVGIHEDIGNDSGNYYRNCKKVSAKRSAYNPTHAKELWAHSVKAVQLKTED